MDTSIDPRFLLPVAAGVILAAWLIRVRRYRDWAIGWSVLVIAGLCNAFPEFGLRTLGFALGPIFPALMLVGAQRLLDRPVPRLLVPAAVAVGLLRAGLFVSWGEPAAALVALAAEPTLLVAAVVVTVRGTRGLAPKDVRRRLLPAALAALALVEAYDAICRLRGWQAPWMGWLLVAAPAIAVQLVSALERSQTDLRSSKDALTKNLIRFRALTGSSNDLVAEMGADGRFTYLSPNVERLLGQPPEHFLGRSLHELAAGFGIVSGRRPEDTLDDLLRDGLFGRIQRVERPDGNTLWLEVEGNEYTTPEGERRAIAVVRDISDRVRMEEQLRLTQRLESLGVLAGGIAHDFNNLLLVILGNASLARERMPEDAPYHGSMGEIEAAAERAGELTRQLLAYAGRHPLEAGPVDLSQLVEEVGRLLETTIPPDVEIRYDLDQELPRILGDPGQLQQIVMNLVTNAAESISGIGEITLRACAVDLDADALRAYSMGAELLPGRYVRLEVSDTGRGMDEETRARIFDPFFSTKATGRGLGLASMLGIVRGHCGGLRLESEPERGTHFEIVLPASAAIAAASDAWDAPAAGRRSGATLLVVDDDDAVRRLARDALGSRGFTILEACNGLDAVELFRKHATEIGAVVLDRIMPGMDGAGALREIRSLRPEVPVVVTSGYDEDPSSPRGSGRTSFLLKPYRAQRLVEAVFAALDSARADDS